MPPISRRDLLKTGVATALGSAWPFPRTYSRQALGAPREKLPVAAVVTVYTKNSHADVIIGKILDGYRQDGGPGPDLKVVSIYTDQVPAGELSRAKAEEHGFRVCKTIDEALTLGTNQIQVAGVISIGEHGDYKFTPDTQQHMYPRRRFFDEITATFARCGKVVPVFNDKHLGYRWEDALAMRDTAAKMKFPLLAGSSLPVAWRTPRLELPADCEIEAALSIRTAKGGRNRNRRRQRRDRRGDPQERSGGKMVDGAVRRRPQADAGQSGRHRWLEAGCRLGGLPVGASRRLEVGGDDGERTVRPLRLRVQTQGGR
ncbi:MAG: hypothetical protein NT069_14820 [Planctomycetota bacterium]|nr:hypothetical protein [Planctomycetota bacterium]